MQMISDNEGENNRLEVIVLEVSICLARKFFFSDSADARLFGVRASVLSLLL